MKKIVICVLAIVLSVSLSSCGSKKVEGEITVWWPGSEIEVASLKKAKELYEAENEGVTIRIVPQATSEFYASYMLSLEGQDYPDIAYVDHVYVQQLAKEGSILNLSEAGYDDIKDQFLDSVWNTGAYEGSNYALPFSANTLATVYNKTLLNEVFGRTFTDADLPKNYQELLDICKKIKKFSDDNNRGITPYTIPSGASSSSFAAMSYLSFTARFGGNIISDDLKTMQINSTPSLKAAQAFSELGKLGYTSNVFEEGRFESGNVAFIEMGSWKIKDYSRIAESRGIEFGYAPIIPFLDGGTNESTLGLFSLVVTKKSINAQIAADFVKFIATNDEIQLTHSKAQNLMPTTKTAIEDDFYKEGVWPIYTKQLENIVARPGIPVWSAIETELATFMNELIRQSRNADYVYALNQVFQDSLDES